MEEQRKSFASLLVREQIELPIVTYVASKRLINRETNLPMEWELRPIRTDELDRIEKECTHKRLIPGTRDYKKEFDEREYRTKMALASVVYPNLNEAELQDMFDASSAEELLSKMLLGGEYAKLMNKVLAISEFEPDFDEQVDAAKNS